MRKRLISSIASEIHTMTKEEKILSIRMSEGRIIMSEVTTIDAPDTLSNACLGELYGAMGVDCLMLNAFEVLNPVILKLHVDNPNDVIKTLKKFTDKLVGINLEAIPEQIKMNVETYIPLDGCVSKRQTLIKPRELGCDFISLTGNPNTGVTNDESINQVRLAKN